MRFSGRNVESLYPDYSYISLELFELPISRKQLPLIHLCQGGGRKIEIEEPFQPEYYGFGGKEGALELAGQIKGKGVEKVLPDIPLGRAGTPADIADVIVFLASDHARWLTGQVIKVSGGHNL